MSLTSPNENQPSSLFLDYRPGDEEAFAHIWNEALKTCTWYPKHGPLTIDKAKEHIEHEKKNSTYRLIFAVQDSKPIGFIEAAMENTKSGFIFPYRPCILPSFQEPNLRAILVEAALDHLVKKGARTVKFSINGSFSDVTPYINLYQKMSFEMCRRAYLMQRNLDNIPEPDICIQLRLLTAMHLGIEAFVKFFMECFHDSKDRDASLIAADIRRTEQFIQHLIEQEGKRHDPDCWIVAFMQDKFAGFAIAIEQRNNGLVAEVGVAPHFRKRGIATWLSIKVLQRLKDRGFKQAFLGVDIQNIPAIRLYEKLGFKKLPEEIFELQKRII